MRFALDIVFFDAAWRVVRTVRNLPPWRCSLGGWHACAALELQTGWFDPETMLPDIPVELE
jgi:uncharacterized membrane protein (UPF0127 family)